MHDSYLEIRITQKKKKKNDAALRPHSRNICTRHDGNAAGKTNNMPFTDRRTAVAHTAIRLVELLLNTLIKNHIGAISLWLIHDLGSQRPIHKAIRRRPQIVLKILKTYSCFNKYGKKEILSPVSFKVSIFYSCYIDLIYQHNMSLDQITSDHGIFGS